MNNRDILIIGALILGGAIALELYTNYADPFIDYAIRPSGTAAPG